MNNDTPQPHNAFNGNGQPNQPAPRFSHYRRAPQSIDSFRRPGASPQQHRPMQSQGAPRPRHDMPYSHRPSQPQHQQMPPRPVSDPSFAPQQVPVNQPAPQRPMHNLQPHRPMQDPSFGPPQPRQPQQHYPQQSMRPQQMPPRPVSDPGFAPQQVPVNQPAPQRPMQPQGAPAQNSIYPNPNNGRPSMAQPAPQATAAPAAKAGGIKNDTAVTLLMVFGAFMVVMSALSLITWINLGLKSASTIIGALLALGELGLGVGILMRREIARFIFVIVGCVLLVFSIVGTVGYIGQQSKNDSSNTPQMIGLQHDIQSYQNNDSISADQKAKYIAALEKSETVVQGQQATINDAGKVVVPLRNIIVGYVIAILPIVFLTRPSVKKVFS